MITMKRVEAQQQAGGIGGAGGPGNVGGAQGAPPRMLYAAPFVQDTLPKLETDIKNTEALLEQALQQPNLTKQQKHEVQLALNDVKKIENDFPVARPGGGTNPVPGTPGGPIINLPNGGKVVVAPMLSAGAPPTPIMNPPWGGFSQFQQRLSAAQQDFQTATNLIKNNRGDLNRSGLESPQLNDIEKKIGAAEKALKKIQTLALPQQ